MGVDNTCEESHSYFLALRFGYFIAPETKGLPLICQRDRGNFGLIFICYTLDNERYTITPESGI